MICECDTLVSVPPTADRDSHKTQELEQVDAIHFMA